MPNITAGDGIDTTLTSSENDKLILVVRSMHSWPAGEGIDTTLTWASNATRFMQSITAGEGIDTTLLDGTDNMQCFNAKLIWCKVRASSTPSLQAAGGFDTILQGKFGKGGGVRDAGMAQLKQRMIGSQMTEELDCRCVQELSCRCIRARRALRAKATTERRCTIWRPRFQQP
jgi:hypothetical protein